VSGPAEYTGRPLDGGGASVDGELRLAVEDHEHLLDHVVEVVADAGARRNHAAVQEIELWCDGAAIQEHGERHGAGAAMHGRQWAISRRIRVHNPLGQRARCPGTLRPRRYHGDGDENDEQERVFH